MYKDELMRNVNSKINSNFFFFTFTLSILMTKLLDAKSNINVPISSWAGVIFTRSKFRIWCEMVASQGSNYFYAIIFFIPLFMHNR